MKRKLFIGSSSESKEIAAQLRAKINASCDDWLISETWDQGNVFTLNENALDSLVKAARKYDYGVLIAAKDDMIRSRGLKTRGPRDNVLLEMGMFLGSLGLTRAFLLVEKESKLPTDYNGVTVPLFQKNKAGSLDAAINTIINTLNTTRSSYNLKPVPSVALALGYFDNFIQPLARKRQEQNIDFKLEILIPKNIKDIHSEKIEYKNTYASTEISIFQEGTRPFVFALDSASHHYWDIPTTLSTLGKLIDLLLPSSEVGIHHEKQDWIDHELRNFAGTIMTLVEGCVACRHKVTVTKL